MTVNFRIKNEKAFRKSLDGQKKRKKRNGEDALQTAGIHLENAIKRKLTGQRHGRRYQIKPGSPTKYTASAPGEPPAVKLSRLMPSITNSGVERRLKGGMVIRVGTNVEYAKDLEYGNRARHLEPRPFMGVTFREELNRLRSIIRRAMGR